jgi:hypothetical protein
MDTEIDYYSDVDDDVYDDEVALYETKSDL